MQRSAMFPGARMRQRQVGGGVPTREDRLTPAILCKTPKTVYDLWVEYQQALEETNRHANLLQKREGRSSSSIAGGRLFGM